MKHKEKIEEKKDLCSDKTRDITDCDEFTHFVTRNKDIYKLRGV